MSVVDSDSGIPALDPQPPRGWLGVEWPTMVVAIAIYAAWLGLTWFQARIPIWLLLPAGAITIAWHGSLQNEVIHRHPTRLRWLNGILAFPPLTLWLPLESYRHSHLAHHDTVELTDPQDDPHPHLPWYRLPQVYRTHRAAYLRLNGGLFYPSYGALFRGYLIKPHDVLLHPACRPDASASATSPEVSLSPHTLSRRS